MKFLQNGNNILLLRAFVLSVSMVAALFFWEGHKGFELMDEGYLWYGAQRVMSGEVPARDFLAYDPGRYYWSAMIMGILNDKGIMALRLSVAVFQVLGLFAALLLIGWDDENNDFMFLLLAAVVTSAWMIPYFKIFDMSLSIILMCALAFLIKSPVRSRYFMVGCCVGLAAFFGRNHGVYGFVASIGVILWLELRRKGGVTFVKGFMIWSLGILVGYSPMFLMILFVPEFSGVFFEGIIGMIKARITNLPLPVPWPWHVDFALAPVGQAIRMTLIGFLFIVIITFGFVSLLWVFWKRYQGGKVRPSLTASAFLALPYAHYAYSRPDIEHLILGIFPLLVGILVLLTTLPPRLKWSLALIFCFICVWFVHVYHPGWNCYEEKWVKTEVSGDELMVNRNMAGFISSLRNLANIYASENRNLVIVPFFPGAYPLLEKKSPLFEIYVLINVRSPRDGFAQSMELERLKHANPSLVMISNRALDGRDEWRYSNTHSLIYEYVVKNYRYLRHMQMANLEVYVK